MSLRRTLALVLVVTACLTGLRVAPARAAQSAADQVAADRAKVEAAVAEYEKAGAEQSALDAKVQAASAQLDSLVTQQAACQSQLNARAAAMYRSGDTSPLLILFSASSITDLATRLDFLDTMARQDAENIATLKKARAEAKTSAEGLLELQAQQAEKLDALSEGVARARQDLAGSEAALREYEARVAAAAAAAAAARKAASTKAAPDQSLSGSGEWQTGVASHYARNFTGKGASGEQIGPYSMIVAHKTLPFGTLVEIEYQGKRCVARVADRGPFVAGREFDLGPGVVRVLDFSGVHEIRWRVVGR